MRRFPNIGSLTTELLVAAVHAARPVINVAVSLPGLVKLWERGRQCSPVSHGHSLLKRCGSDLFSLDDAFDSLERANSHFWTAFGMLSSRIRDLGENNLANVVDGVAYFGEGTTMAVGGNARYFALILHLRISGMTDLAFGRYLIQSFRIPTSKVSVGVMSSIMPRGMGMFSASSFVTVNPLRVARFSYRLITGAISDAIPIAIRINRDKSAGIRPQDSTATRELIRVLINRLYESKVNYRKDITDSLMQGCSGLSLMLGYSGPWAALLRMQCEASALAMEVFSPLS